MCQPQNQVQSHSKKMSHKQADSEVEITAKPKGGSLSAVPKDDRPEKPAISTLLASLKS